MLSCEFESGRDVQHYVLKFVRYLRQVGGFLRVLWLPQPIKTDRHDITEILLKVALNNVRPKPKSSLVSSIKGNNSYKILITLPHGLFQN
jgi:hypothetical protein